MNETGPAVTAKHEAKCKQARPHDELVAEILDSGSHAHFDGRYGGYL